MKVDALKRNLDKFMDAVDREQNTVFELGETDYIAHNEGGAIYSTIKYSDGSFLDFCMRLKQEGNNLTNTEIRVGGRARGVENLRVDVFGSGLSTILSLFVLIGKMVDLGRNLKFEAYNIQTKNGVDFVGVLCLESHEFIDVEASVLKSMIRVGLVDVQNLAFDDEGELFIYERPYYNYISKPEISWRHVRGLG